ncbi:MAG TPA: class I SAM-dependent methyltransferase [Blastocatellia bacterium]|nr:class I SAM-dependent methyltransferase [Blastocatellia bacterium]
MLANNVIVIVYTTLYRKGGHQFPAVARTLGRERGEGRGFEGEVVSRAVESKRELLQIFADVKAAGKQISEFHFVGHSGIYGPMFGTVAFPEQFSPYEWENMDIPFADDASAYFHCCRSARWFAPFFSRTFNKKAYGFFWYTTFSCSKTHFRYAGSDGAAETLYTIGCKGRKSHGLGLSLLKFTGLLPAEQMKVFYPTPPTGDISYNRVAELYDHAFADIKVRRDEWEWISGHLPKRPGLRVLDIGCGNGALLRELSERIEYGAGIDESEAMLEKARNRTACDANLEFVKISSPSLPFSDRTFDVVVSLMSFRYLDWDPLLKEVRRVMKSDGRFLIVDMVTVPVKTKEYPRLIKDKLVLAVQRKTNRTFKANLKRLVTHPDWKKMLEYNPIRSEHEMKWYLESRFPERRMEILNLGFNARIVAFDSGPVEQAVEVALSYP